MHAGYVQSCELRNLFGNFRLDLVSFFRNGDTIGDIHLHADLHRLILSILLRNDSFYALYTATGEDVIDEATLYEADALNLRKALQNDCLKYAVFNIAYINRLRKIKLFLSNFVLFFVRPLRLSHHCDLQIE